MNSAAMAEIERQQDPEEQTEAIDNAIVQAAKAVQAEAREARAAAIRDREKAEQLAEEAESRVRQAEEAKREEIARAEAAAAEAIKNESARGQQAVLSERARAEQAALDLDARRGEELRAEREAHNEELQKREDDLRIQAASAARLKRRVRLFGIGFGLTLLFIVVGLVGGVDTAWQYVVGAGVIFGVMAALDQLLGQKDP
jgi:hypothetical protein